MIILENANPKELSPAFPKKNDSEELCCDKVGGFRFRSCTPTRGNYRRALLENLINKLFNKAQFFMALLY